MKQTARMMLALLSAAVCGAPLADGIKENITAERLKMLYALSSHHDMAHLVGYSLEAAALLSDGEVREGFGRQQMLAVYREAGQSEALSELCCLFEAEGIDYLPLKGAVIRGLYPEAWMRTGCDVDVLVRPEEAERASDLLCRRLGYRREGRRNAHDLSLMGNNGVNIEIHFNMIEADCAAQAASVLSHAWEHASVCSGKHGYCLSDAMFYFYHVAHMAKHFEHGGCGVKPVLDLWLLRHSEERDEAARAALLSEGGLSVFEAACASLSEAWFAHAEWDGLVDDMSRYLLMAGVYGSAQNRAAVGQAKQGSRGKNLLSRVWRPYEILKHQYPSLEGRRWLTPFYQVCRWSHLLRRDRMEESIRELRAGGEISDDHGSITAELLEKLKL